MKLRELDRRELVRVNGGSEDSFGGSVGFVNAIEKRSRILGFPSPGAEVPHDPRADCLACTWSRLRA